MIPILGILYFCYTAPILWRIFRTKGYGKILSIFAVYLSYALWWLPMNLIEGSSGIPIPIFILWVVITTFGIRLQELFMIGGVKTIKEVIALIVDGLNEHEEK